jgi:hypothetical protein
MRLLFRIIAGFLSAYVFVLFGSIFWRLHLSENFWTIVLSGWLISWMILELLTFCRKKNFFPRLLTHFRYAPIAAFIFFPLPEFRAEPFVIEEKTAKTLDCRRANEYRFEMVDNPGRQKDSEPVSPEDVNIVVGDEVISKIELPKESEAKNFLLDSIEKDNVGFEIKVNWGGGIYHYEVQFNFRCKKNHFYLYRVKKVSLSTTNPDSGNFLDKRKIKVTKIEPNLPIEKFVMTKFL